QVPSRSSNPTNRSWLGCTSRLALPVFSWLVSFVNPLLTVEGASTAVATDSTGDKLPGGLGRVSCTAPARPLRFTDGMDDPGASYFISSNWPPSKPTWKFARDRSFRRV